MCLTPIYQLSENKHGRQWVKAPCGNCEQCLLAKQRDWQFRISWELSRVSKSCFFTTTYDNEHVREVVITNSGQILKTLHKKDIQNWFKYVRTMYFRKYGKDLNFKYYVCGEYGPTTLRPHYHGILLGISAREYNIYFAPYWKYGFQDCKDVTFSNGSFYSSAKYLSKYAQKGDYFENPFARLGLVAKPFKLVSKHFGESYSDLNKGFHLASEFEPKFIKGSKPLAYTDEYLEVIKKRLIVTINGYTYSLPRYFREKIFGKNSHLSVSLRDYIYKASDRLRLEQLAQLQTKYGVSTINEAAYLLNIKDFSNINAKRVEIREKLASFYTKSKI